MLRVEVGALLPRVRASKLFDASGFVEEGGGGFLSALTWQRPKQPTSISNFRPHFETAHGAFLLDKNSQQIRSTNLQSAFFK
jgi:hypothetical protein